MENGSVRIRKQNIERRIVIETYAKYDCSKKGRPVPAFATWDWLEADAIDVKMCCAGLKTGIPAGYLLWDEVEVTMPDFHECAVCDGIFPEESRRLGSVGDGALAAWKAHPNNLWYEDIKSGQTLDDTAPLMFRPAVRTEFPACWYLEDGSGRAIAFVANQHIFAPSRTLAIGYVGRKPDSQSSFMQTKFPELLLPK